ncbi:poly-gamma-glutamate synthase PgsB [Moorena sp. SIO3I6]|uniref:poly-gamma-glutamate synthase PgsB n=1 Tax=Moorena sp. SIO3I6 TaxID=2607831 RepID=UPI0025D5BC74|nr:poly-gamma-glutamate synthase PgsB [Moorena sp. SIO3I6]
MITVATIIMLIVLGLEYVIHIKNLMSIPVRIHVNGSRGKSSVTRLIAGGLREGGFKVFAKTTGTQPRLITDKGRELPVYRIKSKANIIEQLKIVAFAAKNQAEVLVIECMALNPRLQAVTELNMIKSTHGVITNVRADHLDVMGPRKRDVTLALLGTIPKNGKLFTAAQDYREDFQMACQDRNSELLVVSPAELERISDEDMSKFAYIEHKENVALALTVCSALNVSKDIALKGMYKATPDIGSMKEYTIDKGGEKIVFINGFAANDIESTEKNWNNAVLRHSEKPTKIMVINTRKDRISRSQEIGQYIIQWKPADKYIVIGEKCDVLIKIAIGQGIADSEIINAEGLITEDIWERIVEISEASSMVMGVGNIKDGGVNLIELVEKKAKLTGEVNVGK